MTKLDITSKKSLREHGIIATGHSFILINPEEAIREQGPKILEMLQKAFEAQERRKNSK